MILRTQLKGGQKFDDPSAIYFAKSNNIMQSGILFVLVRRYVAMQHGVHLPIFTKLHDFSL